MVFLRNISVDTMHKEIPRIIIIIIIIIIISIITTKMLMLFLDFKLSP
jgi:hypothetical protein